MPLRRGTHSSCKRSRCLFEEVRVFLQEVRVFLQEVGVFLQEVGVLLQEIRNRFVISNLHLLGHTIDFGR